MQWGDNSGIAADRARKNPHVPSEEKTQGSGKPPHGCASAKDNHHSGATLSLLTEQHVALREINRSMSFETIVRTL